MLAFVFQRLATRKPDLDAGIFAYAKAGFGDYVGFNSAFGFWASACAGNTSYWVVIMTTTSALFPALGAGDTVLAVVVSSIGVWLFRLPDLARRQGGRDHQPDRHHRQGRADPGVHRHRGDRVQGRRVRRQLLGRRRPLVRLGLRAGQGHDAHHRVRLPRHRGRQRLLPVRPQARGRRARHRHRIPQCAQRFRARDAGVLRRHAAARARRRQPAVDGVGAGIHCRTVGIGVHPRRRRRLGARRLPRVDADGRRDPLHPRQDRRHAAVPGPHQRQGRAGHRAGDGRRADLSCC